MYKCPNNLGFFIYLCGRNYNRFLNMMNYREINWEVMIDTKIRTVPVHPVTNNYRLKNTAFYTFLGSK